MGDKKLTKRLLKCIAHHKGRCFYCQLSVDVAKVQPHPRAPTLDHVTPRSRGGKNTATNRVLACYLCNHQKGDMTLDEFRAYRRAILILGLSKREALRCIRAANSAGNNPNDEGRHTS